MNHSGVTYRRKVSRILRITTGILFLITFDLLVADQALAAGPPGPPDGGGDPPCWPAPCVPIDGGIGLLLLAGLAYGGKKAYNMMKDKTT